MKKIIFMIPLLIMFATLIVTTSECLALTKIVPETTKDAIVDKYLKNRQLDPVEGIWSYIQCGNYEEIVITKNPSSTVDADYVGIKVAGNAEGNIGQLKITLKKTAAPGIYNGTYLYSYRKKFFTYPCEQATTFVMTEDKVMQTNMPVPTYNSQGIDDGYIGRVSFIRIDNFETSAPAAEETEVLGTGFFIKNDLVATNSHVIHGAKKITVTYGDKKVSATVLSEDPDNDVAILKVTGLEQVITPLPLGDPRTVELGETVYTVGFPLPDMMGFSPKAGDGIINSLTGFGDDLRSFQISIPIQPGNSGGPLINGYGQVIGITRASLDPAYTLKYAGTIPQNVNYAVKISYLLIASPVNLSYSQDKVALATQEIIQRATKAVVFIDVVR